MIEDRDVWPTVHNDDLWIFDKLILSKKLGHLCGPAGVHVPKPGNYIVRPCVNLAGMGQGAHIRWLEGHGEETWDIPPGYFWQEMFEGRHLSVDYENGSLIRCTEGIRHTQDLTRFHHWKVVDDEPFIPLILRPLIYTYERVNIEMIGEKVIEVHLRGNPDFDDGAVDIIPVWKDSITKCPEGYVFIQNEAYDRIGFYKRYK